MVLFYGFFEAKESFDNRNEECESLATASHRLKEKSLAAHARVSPSINYLNHDVFVAHEQRKSAGLHWGHSSEAHSRDGIEDPFRE